MPASAPVLFSLGEILWDQYPDRRLLGGAPFNLAAHADDARLIKMWFGRPETDDAPATSHDEL